MKQAEEYLVHLLRCVLENKKPVEKPEEFTFERLYKIAVFHNCESMAFYGINKLENKPEQNLFNSWKRKRDQYVIMSLNQLNQRDVVIKKLTEGGIRVLPLKGCLLKEMYPRAEYRQMADLDMLIDSKNSPKAREIMMSLGYRNEQYDNEAHDTYELPPYMNIELHTTMVSSQYEYSKYYKDVWNRAEAELDESGNATGRYDLNWNDYYIFMIVHLAKHYYTSGTGIRTIMDVHVFREKHEQNLDRAYLEKEFEKLNLVGFWKDAESLAEIWFGEGEYTPKLEEMEKYIYASGAYGTFQQKVENRLNNFTENGESVEKAKRKYFFKRMFMSYDVMCHSYRVLRKFPVLLPFCWVHRWIYALINKKSVIKSELEIMKKTKK